MARTSQTSRVVTDPFATEWRGMPAFKHRNLRSQQKIVVHFERQSDVDKFAALVGQDLSPNTRSIWFPPVPIRRYGIAS
jgi:hypothetical protein